ncbi:hypothetical protein R3P38DRAFT_2512236 [Favolaschia claudopus]|uniref:Uncharacterized protein n=1 Tax=Favolaschia claudopus TaxID=2862362 RepID=A0AAW0CRM1_9AGAR
MDVDECIAEGEKDNVLLFPPQPASKELRHKILTGFCRDIEPSRFEEAGCTVCGLLIPKSKLTLKDEVMIDWDLLKADRG